MTRAFTLIELLIVVAIIAVVTAIGLVNFQTATVRGKVSRAKADLHAQELALGQYYLDNEQYPPATSFCSARFESRFDYHRMPVELTTPIPYLTSLPHDIFNEHRNRNGEEDHYGHPLRYKYTAPGDGIANGSPGVITVWVPRDYPSQSGKMIPYRDPANSPVQYGIWSVGPTGALEPLQSDWSYIPVRQASWYDPTNGTVSSGVIVRLSGGATSP